MPTPIKAEHLAAMELPFAFRACHAYGALWSIGKAIDFCKYLIAQPEIDTITPEEYTIAKSIANGEPFTAPETVYTREDWCRDRTLSALPGQEIEEEIYWEMFNVLPPYSLPRVPRTKGYASGFLVSEPDSINPFGSGQLYGAYAKSGDKYYYLGLLPRR